MKLTLMRRWQVYSRHIHCRFCTSFYTLGYGTCSIIPFPCNAKLLCFRYPYVKFIILASWVSVWVSKCCNCAVLWCHNTCSGLSAT